MIFSHVIRNRSYKTKTKARIVLSLTSRLNTTVTDAEVERNPKGCKPANTARSTAWAM